MFNTDKNKKKHKIEYRKNKGERYKDINGKVKVDN